MSGPQTERVKTLKGLVGEARERLARDVLNVDQVLTQAAAMASQGYDRFLVEQAVPLSLDQTPTGKATAETLAAQGLKVSWERATCKADDKANPTGIELIFKKLQVSW